MKSNRRRNNVVSFLDKLDPRTKIISTLFLTTYTFFIRDTNQIFVMLVFLLFLFILGKINLIYFIKNYKFSILLAIGIFLFHIIWNLNNTNNLFAGMFASSRILIIIMTANVLFAVTPLEELGEGVKTLFKILKFKYLNIADIVFMIGFALRFMPILFNRLKNINKSRKHKKIAHASFIGVLFEYLKKYENKMVFFVKRNTSKNIKIFAFCWRDYTVFLFMPIFFIFIINLV
jgi:energy-coupling factor transporter transmembrane protein EcfT